MGGFRTMRLALKYPDLFTSIVAFARGYRFPDEMDTAHQSFMPIQMYVGDQDPGLTGNRRMHAVLMELGIPCGYQEFPGIAHNLGKLAEQVQTQNFVIAAQGFGSVK